MHEHRKIRFAIGSFGELCGNATKWTAQVLAFVFQSSANRNANVSFLSSSPFPPNCSDADRDAILCPYDLMGRCEDKQCKYKHIKMWFTVRLGRKILRFLFYHKTKQIRTKSVRNKSVCLSYLPICICACVPCFRTYRKFFHSFSRRELFSVRLNIIEWDTPNSMCSQIHTARIELGSIRQKAEGERGIDVDRR